MVQDFTLHTHTLGFDGKNTAEQMIETARAAGFKTIGISNHFIVHPKIKSTKMYAAAAERGYSTIYSDSFEEALSRFQPHYDELARLQDKNPDIRILRGMEVDRFPTTQWADGFARVCEILKPDYLIGSAHFVEYGGTVCNIHDMMVADADRRDEMLETYWKNAQESAKSGIFNWMAHLDLPKKLNLGVDEKWDAIKRETVAVIAESRTPVEINTSGFKIGTDEPYPGPKILQMLAEYDVPVLITDDAHEIGRIGHDFDRAYAMARENGIKNFLTLQKTLDFRTKSV